MTKTKRIGFPPQIKYIIGNEACERFSFYGMRAILVVFMTQTLGMAASDAKANYHFFLQAAYFLPLLGAYISDRFWGKYQTIMTLSIVYCIGHLILALFETPMGMFYGLALIALGAGGIKPCVSAHVGDQFNDTNKHLLDRVFSWFYFSINVGAFLSSLATPLLLVKYGPRIAFGIPGVLMALATVVFWMGRKHYVHVPPTGKMGPAGFMTIAFSALRNRRKRKKDQEFLDAARADHKASEVEGAKSALDIFKVFATVTVFWALFDQQGSSWTLQADKMDLMVWGTKLEASQIQALNPIMVLMLIPIFTYGIYPLVEKLGLRVTPLRKIATGMVFAGLSFACMGLIQTTLDAGTQLSIAWQLIPYFILTASEVMVSITGLEFAYTQAPRSMKSTIMGFWFLTVAAGNMLAAVVAKLNVFTGSGEFYFFGSLMALVSIVFVIAAARYREREFIENNLPAGEPASA